jgi:acyl-CoA reductase-like NAD-dependent aldehyde dehydrogenase
VPDRSSSIEIRSLFLYFAGMVDLNMTIGGERARGSGAFEVVDPARAEVFATAPDCCAGLLDRAMDAAWNAFDSWRGDTLRRKLLRETADALLGTTEELAAILTAGQGKPLAKARMEGALAERARAKADAVERANGTPFGPAASVWSPDLARARRTAELLDCGQVSINVHGGGVRPELPFGGRKRSGVGVANGLWGAGGLQ